MFSVIVDIGLFTEILTFEDSCKWHKCSEQCVYSAVLTVDINVECLFVLPSYIPISRSESMVFIMGHVSGFIVDRAVDRIQNPSPRVRIRNIRAQL